MTMQISIPVTVFIIISIILQAISLLVMILMHIDAYHDDDEVIEMPRLLTILFYVSFIFTIISLLICGDKFSAMKEILKGVIK